MRMSIQNARRRRCDVQAATSVVVVGGVHELPEVGHELHPTVEEVEAAGHRDQLEELLVFEVGDRPGEGRSQMLEILDELVTGFDLPSALEVIGPVQKLAQIVTCVPLFERLTIFEPVGGELSKEWVERERVVERFTTEQCRLNELHERRQADGGDRRPLPPG